MKTDKSEKFSVATIEKYIEMGMGHVKDDKQVTRDEVREIERALNGHCVHAGGKCLALENVITTRGEL